MQPKQLVGKSGKRKARAAFELTDQQKRDLRKVRRYLPRAENVFKKAYSGLSIAAGIKAMCISYSNLQPVEVTRCHISGCPLYRLRPYQARDIQVSPSPR